MSEPERTAASTTISARAMPEMMRLRRGKKSALGSVPGTCSETITPALADRRMKRGILRRVDHVEAARHHGDGAGLERGLMRRRVDAARQAGDDHVALAADLARQLPGEFPRDGGGVARAHDGDTAARQQADVALDAEHRRGVSTWRSRAG